MVEVPAVCIERGKLTEGPKIQGFIFVKSEALGRRETLAQIITCPESEPSMSEMVL